MTGWSVQRIRAKQKTQTRRLSGLQEVNKEPDNWTFLGFNEVGEARFQWGVTCKPRYQIGDLLWVREAWCSGDEWDDTKPSEIDPLICSDIWYFADGPRPTEGWGKTRPAIFMPKWATRIWLEITGIRVERVQDISITDLWAEGLEFGVGATSQGFIQWIQLWDSLNAKRGYPWKSNPWVRAIEFRRCK